MQRGTAVINPEVLDSNSTYVCTVVVIDGWIDRLIHRRMKREKGGDVDTYILYILLHTYRHTYFSFEDPKATVLP